jgi:predicted nucleic acid-binding protein
MHQYPKLKHIDKLVDDEIFNQVSLSRQEYEHFRELIAHLGQGEASCIAFAKERNAIVVTDDRRARRQCALMKIPVTGTIGILKASVLDGHLKLDQADKILSKMTGIGFYSPIRSIADII